MKKILAILFIGALILISCEKEYEPTKTATVEFSGKWWVHHNVEGSDLFGAGYGELNTYNTAANDGKEIWINDDYFWSYRIKCPVDLENLTFQSDTFISAYPDYPIKIVIQNGKIIKDGGTTLAGRTVDSIYYEVWFEDWPEVIDLYGLPFPYDTYFEVGGVAHTGFDDDDTTH